MKLFYIYFLCHICYKYNDYFLFWKIHVIFTLNSSISVYFFFLVKVEELNYSTSFLYRMCYVKYIYNFLFWKIHVKFIDERLFLFFSSR